MFICPKCGKRLTDAGKSLVCPDGHCYDKAKSGYVNLLPANQMRSKLPGDNRLMVQSRRKFLDKGYYGILAENLCAEVLKYVCGRCKILDAGCGEGYYTEKVADAVKDAAAEIIGIDISKNAADYAARRTKSVRFAVSSVFHLPIETESCDIVTNLFAPYCGKEFLRVMKRDGIFIMVIPAERHLWQLKCAVYDEPYLNEAKDFALEGFEHIGRKSVSGEIVLSCGEDIMSLFSMTPYVYKTGAEGQKRLESLDSLTTEIGFEILTYRKL